MRCDQAWCAKGQRDLKEPLPAKFGLGLNALSPLDLALLFCSWAGSHGLASIVLVPAEHYLIQAPVIMPIVGFAYSSQTDLSCQMPF